MIIRVFEGRLKPGGEQDYMAGERELLGRTDIPGLTSQSLGRRIGPGGQLHVITITVWADRESLERWVPDAFDTPVYLAGSEDLVESWTLHHFEQVEEIAGGFAT